MSRIGKAPIILPAGVQVKRDDNIISVVGPKGTLIVSVDGHIATTITPERLVLSVGSVSFAAIHGLTRALIYNAVVGVTKGWEKTVELVGVGYRAQGGGNELTLTIGFTHPVKMVAPPFTTFSIADNTKITVSGIDKKVVGEMAAKIRSVRPPEPYKGKGIRYSGEVVRKKAGKAVKATGAAA
ncbi:MAG: 50S ribosomal protein L6 [Patescibacteria group bacterium]